VNVATTWDDVPLVVVGVSAVAPLLGLSVSTIERRLADGTMTPPPLPRTGREPWRWSKTKLRAHVDGVARRTA